MNQMKKEYHILNGDALKEQFPQELSGDIIVARECLVEGDLNGSDLGDLYKTRADFIVASYDDVSIQDYYQGTVSEFEKIRHIPKESKVNLWFEDDLFCQVNFWFVVSLLSNSCQHCKLFLVRPKKHTRFGFGGLSETALIEIYKQRLEVNEIKQIALLWECYQKADIDKLLEIAEQLKDVFPFILTAVEAHIARIPTQGFRGRPVQTLLDIMNDLDTEEFGPVFREFSTRESIYGFGDSQVKRLLHEAKKYR